MTETVSAQQGSQPTVGRLRIGIVAAATIDGVSKAKLLLRPDSGDTTVVLTKGEPLDVPGYGSLTLDGVQEPDAVHPIVTLTLAG